MIWYRALFSLWLAFAMLAGVQASGAAVDLPQKAPVPPSGERPPTLPPASPVPEEKPAGTPSHRKPTGTAKEAGKTPMPTDPRSDVRPIEPMPKQQTACRQKLKALGVEFEERKPVHDGENGCAIPYPMTVTRLGPDIALEPQAEMNCEMAEAVVRFMVRTVLPAAKAHFSAGLKSVDQASAYVCRPRHNGEKMSEHAFGNALDIAGFTLSDDTRIAVEPRPSEKNARFLDEIRKAACGPFKTVLGPGSDPDHELHFHLDLEPRRNGGTFCQ